MHFVRNVYQEVSIKTEKDIKAAQNLISHRLIGNEKKILRFYPQKLEFANKIFFKKIPSKVKISQNRKNSPIWLQDVYGSGNF